MKTAEEILKSKKEWNYGHYRTKECLEAMEEYASQFIYPVKCHNCEGSGVVSNTTCINCNGIGKIVLLPPKQNT